MENVMKDDKPACAASGLSDVLDANALNDAGWAFIDAWSKHTDQAMSGNTWNNIKPMVAAAIRKYLEATATLRSYTWERYKAEIDKCALLCANCHRLRHWKQAVS